jgi:Flp pilus assembly protein TadB
VGTLSIRLLHQQSFHSSQRDSRLGKGEARSNEANVFETDSGLKQSGAEALCTTTGGIVIIFGLILLLIGFVTGIPIVWTIGMIVLVVGLVLWVLGSMGRAVGGRRHYY